MTSPGGADRETDEPPDRRWPRSVYSVGDEPDPRVSLANERTFLAWIRTSLAFIAGGVGLTAYGVVTKVAGSPLVLVAAMLLIACGVAGSIGALATWMRNERALRLNRPLPGSVLLPMLTGALIVFAVAALALTW